MDSFLEISFAAPKSAAPTDVPTDIPTDGEKSGVGYVYCVIA